MEPVPSVASGAQMKEARLLVRMREVSSKLLLYLVPLLNVISVCCCFLCGCTSMLVIIILAQQCLMVSSTAAAVLVVVVLVLAHGHTLVRVHNISSVQQCGHAHNNSTRGKRSEQGEQVVVNYELGITTRASIRVAACMSRSRVWQSIDRLQRQCTATGCKLSPGIHLAGRC